MKSTAWTNDTGRAADRVASIVPAELHAAICQAAIDAIRNGIPAHLLDGHTVHRAGGLIGAVRNKRSDRIAHLDQEIADARRRANRARANANNEDDPELAADYRDDARQHLERIRQLDQQLTELTAAEDGVVTNFDSGADYVAHALARVSNIERDTNGTIADALSHILHITGIDLDDPGLAHLTFYIDVPADDRVARLGPIRATVANHAYRNTITRDARGDLPHKILAGVATAHGLAPQMRTSPHHVLAEVADELGTAALEGDRLG